MPIMSLSQAAKLALVDRATIRRKLQRGELSYSQREDGAKGIELSELARLYPHVVRQEAPGDMPMGMLVQSPGNPLEMLQREMDLVRLRQEVESLRQQLANSQRQESLAQEREARLLTMLEQEQAARQVMEQRLLPPPRRGLLERVGKWLERLKHR